jgi:hypothetical protein
VQLVFSDKRPQVLPRGAVVLRALYLPRTGVRSTYWRLPGAARYRLFWSDAGTFELDAAAGRVVIHAKQPVNSGAVEEVLRGPVSSFVCIERGFEPLHAGAVGLGRHCVAFAGPPGAGKSSLTAYFLSRGATFLSDDMLPLRLVRGRVHASRGWPRFRLTQLSARKLGYSAGGARAGPKQTHTPATGSHRTKLPLSRIYFLRRQISARGRVRIRPLAAGDAFRLLLANTSNVALLSPARLQRQVEILARLVESVPARELVYPSSYARLPEVRRAILRDTASGRKEKARGRNARGLVNPHKGKKT